MPETRQQQNFVNGVLVSSTPYQVSDAQLRGEAAIARLINGRTQLRQIRDQAQAASSGGAFANLAAASTAIRQIAGAVNVLAQTLMDLELIAAYQQDDGSD